MQVDHHHSPLNSQNSKKKIHALKMTMRTSPNYLTNTTTLTKQCFVLKNGRTPSRCSLGKSEKIRINLKDQLFQILQTASA